MLQAKPMVALRLIAGLSLMLAMTSGCVTRTMPRQVPIASKDFEAEAEFQSGAKRPPSAKTLYAMSKLMALQGRDSEAEYTLGKIVSEHPEFMPAYCDLAETQMRQRRIDQAMKTLTTGLRLAPNEAILLNNLGMCQMIKGEYDSALDAFTRAAAVVPDDARYRANMAVSLGMLGRYKESFALYEQVLPAADAHYNLGVLCEARKDNARAAEEYRQAKNLKALEARSGNHSEVDAPSGGPKQGHSDEPADAGEKTIPSS